MYSQEGGGNGQGEQEVTSPSHYIFEQFQNSYQFRILFTNPEKIFELLCPFNTLHVYVNYKPLTKPLWLRLETIATIGLLLHNLISELLKKNLVKLFITSY